MKYYYSKELDSFYPEELRKWYDKIGSWPCDALEVTYEQFEQFSLTSKENHKRTFSTEAGFEWTIIPPTASAESERAWRNLELQRSDVELYKVQDSDPKAVGAVSQWREYRKNLRNWPEHGSFPNKEFRPVSPDV